MSPLEKRVIDLAYKFKLSHIGSCLTTLPVIERVIDKGDLVLGNGHAALALYVSLEARGKCDAEKLAGEMGTHNNRSLENGILVSGGSLGQPETVAVGMALADRNKQVCLVTSDGACAEGSVWEALRIAGDNKLDNLSVSVVANGFSAYDRVDLDRLETRLRTFFPVDFYRISLDNYPKWLHGLDGHYVILDEEKYNELRRIPTT
jgi:transketolase N-terminal domain/subunit